MNDFTELARRAYRALRMTAGEDFQNAVMAELEEFLYPVATLPHETATVVSKILKAADYGELSIGFLRELFFGFPLASPEVENFAEDAPISSHVLIREVREMFPKFGDARDSLVTASINALCDRLERTIDKECDMQENVKTRCGGLGSAKIIGDTVATLSGAEPPYFRTR